MINTTTSSLPQTLQEAIAQAAAAAHLTKPERIKVHRTNLQAIGFHEGAAGVQAYKAQNPDSKEIQVRVNSLAYIKKPKGYDTYLVSQAERWLCCPRTLAQSNTGDVQSLNKQLGTSYPPGKHFSEPLSQGRLKKIKAAFARNHTYLDLKTVKTMSQVKAAARAATVQIASERRLGSAGVISGNTLVISGQPFTVTRNGQRECIRVVIGETRQRVYLEQIEWLADLFGVGTWDPLNTTTVRSMGEVAYPDVPADLPAIPPVEISELASGETCKDDPLNHLPLWD